jgi:putative ABC transport system permease protein
MHTRLLRGFVRSPGFAATVLLTLAIGIGASTAVFSVVNGVLLRSLPYPDADRLVSIRHSAPGAPGIAEGRGLLLSQSMVLTYAEHNSTFQSFGAWSAVPAAVTGLAEPEEVRAIAAGEGLFETLGVPPAFGRPFAAAEFTVGGPFAVVLSHDYWQRRFGGDQSVIGRTVTINSRQAEIVGVMPRGFRVADTASDIIMPLAIDRGRLTLPPFFLEGVARLKPGATLADANADVARMLPIWLDSWPYRFDAHEVYERGWRIAPALQPLKQAVVGDVGNVLWVVMGTVGLVLLIACANVANLLLVRAESRRREVAVRAALGAGAWRIGRGLLAEAVGVAALGGVLGLALAYGGLELLLAMGPATLPRLSEISLDLSAVAFAIAASVLLGAFLGGVVALKHAGPAIGTALHAGGGRGSSHSRERHRTQATLVVVQVALTLVLLVSSGLMIRTFQALRTVEPGFTSAAEIQTLRIGISPTVVAETERVLRTQNDIVDALAAIPGVESAAFASSMPLEGVVAGWDGITAEGVDDGGGLSERPMRTFKYVSPGFFATAGTRLVAGRDLTWSELHAGAPVAIISENLSRELFGEPAAAVSKRIRTVPDTPWREIIGVVQDVYETSVSTEPPKIVYWPSLMRNPWLGAGDQVTRQTTVILRSSLAGTAPLARQIEQAVWSVNPSLPVTSVRTMQEVYDRSLAQTSFTLVMLAIAGAAALVLGIVGLYGVLSYVVAQRRREIAIRLALGAQPRAVTRDFVRYGVVLAAVGIAIGLGAAFGVTRLMESLLYSVAPTDVVTYAGVAVFLTVVAALASYIPARRASGVDPAEALAAE